MLGFLFVILDLAVIAALTAFIPSVVYFLHQQRKRANASITLIHQYAKRAQKNNNLGIIDLKKSRDKIEMGDPYGEPARDFTPLLFYAKGDELSFERISEILRYLKTSEQTLLLEYFAAQSEADAILHEINTDYFRSIPQERKMVIINMLIEATEKLKIATDNLVDALDSR